MLFVMYQERRLPVENLLHFLPLLTRVTRVWAHLPNEGSAIGENSDVGNGGW